MFERLKQKWNITTNAEFIRIMIVFSLAGINVSLVRKPLFHLFGFTDATPLWLKTCAYILFIFPTYQLSLLMYAAIFGELEFFWEKQKRLGAFIARKFTQTRTASDK